MNEEGRHLGPPTYLVEPEWLDKHKNDPDICIIEIDRVGINNYRAGHIPGAIGWNWKEMLWDERMREFPAPDVFARRLANAGISQTTKVIIYGEPVQFGTYAWWVFQYCGHRETYLLNGGHRAWANRGLPLITGEPTPRPRVDYQPLARNETMRARREDVLRAIDDPQSQILDVRSKEEYEGRALGTPEANHGAERFGRIPGALHRHFQDLLEDDDRFKSASEMSLLLGKSGLDNKSDTITYCRLSHRASLVYFAVTQLLGHSHVKVYDGSWTEWGSMVGMPIETPW